MCVVVRDCVLWLCVGLLVRVIVCACVCVYGWVWFSVWLCLRGRASKCGCACGCGMRSVRVCGALVRLFERTCLCVSVAVCCLYVLRVFVNVHCVFVCLCVSVCVVRFVAVKV